ncbi:MAG: FixH family protein [Chloroflexi bacterium]|nr:FixH family protein [Chloroflexota bacterium]
MRRLGVVVAIALAGFVAAIVVFNTPGRLGCPLKADTDRAYAGRFVGPVSTDETSHEIVVTRDGRPLTGVEICVNTEMVGMTGMGYSATARERSPGRFAVPFRFGMAGDYRTNIVAREFDGEIGIPLMVKVGGGMAMGDDDDG